MRDAVGGTFMIRVFLIFLATYIIFIAIALNYAKAFRVKNKVIDIIEQNEGINDFTSDNALDQIGVYMNNIHYNMSNRGVTEDICERHITSATVYFNGDYGYCIGKSDTVEIDENIEAEYYQVATFVDIYIPLVELHYLIPVKGETRKIERKTT